MKRAFSAWKEGLGVYSSWLAAGVVITLLGWPSPLAVLGILLLISGLFALYFFRDPTRTHAAAPDEVLSPADGTVVEVAELQSTPHYDGPCRRVSIFLSIFNVHVNRAPFDGTVTQVAYTPGQFLNAMRGESADLNEAMTIRMDTVDGPMTVRQIAGLVARRIICNVGPGAVLAKGEKFGMIKFGSRTELYLPPHFEVCVKTKAKVRAGATIIARATPHAEGILQEAVAQESPEGAPPSH